MAPRHRPDKSERVRANVSNGHKESKILSHTHTNTQARDSTAFCLCIFYFWRMNIKTWVNRNQHMKCAIRKSLKYAHNQHCHWLRVRMYNMVWLFFGCFGPFAWFRLYSEQIRLIARRSLAALLLDIASNENIAHAHIYAICRHFSHLLLK